MKKILIFLILVVSAKTFACEINVRQQGLALDISFKSQSYETDIAHCVSIVTKKGSAMLMHFRPANELEDFISDELEKEEIDTYKLCIDAAKRCQ